MDARNKVSVEDGTSSGGAISKPISESISKSISKSHRWANSINRAEDKASNLYRLVRANVAADIRKRRAKRRERLAAAQTNSDSNESKYKQFSNKSGFYRIPRSASDALKKKRGEIGVYIRGLRLPTPRELAAYNKALPGLAERVIRMAELEQRESLAARRWRRMVSFISGFGSIFSNLSLQFIIRVVIFALGFFSIAVPSFLGIEAQQAFEANFLVDGLMAGAVGLAVTLLGRFAYFRLGGKRAQRKARRVAKGGRKTKNKRS